jgi:hypothetical protein
MNDRRSFLKMFGVASAVVTNAKADTLEHVTDPEAPALFQRENAYAPVFDRIYREWANYDVHPAMLYYAITIEPGELQREHVFFRSVVGRDGSFLPICDTNMQCAGYLPAPQSFLAREVGFAFSLGVIPALRSQMVSRYAGQLWVGRKEYWTAPLATVFGTADGPDRFSDLPDAAFHSIGETPLVITYDQQFHVDIVGEPFPCHS